MPPHVLDVTRPVHQRIMTSTEADPHRLVPAQRPLIAPHSTTSHEPSSTTGAANTADAVRRTSTVRRRVTNNDTRSPGRASHNNRRGYQAIQSKSRRPTWYMSTNNSRRRTLTTQPRHGRHGRRSRYLTSRGSATPPHAADPLTTSISRDYVRSHRSPDVKFPLHVQRPTRLVFVGVGGCVGCLLGVLFCLCLMCLVCSWCWVFSRVFCKVDLGGGLFLLVAVQIAGYPCVVADGCGPTNPLQG